MSSTGHSHNPGIEGTIPERTCSPEHCRKRFTIRFLSSSWPQLSPDSALHPVPGRGSTQGEKRMNKHKHSLRKKSAEPPGSLPERHWLLSAGSSVLPILDVLSINSRLHQTGKRQEEASESSCGRGEREIGPQLRATNVK